MATGRPYKIGSLRKMKRIILEDCYTKDGKPKAVEIRPASKDGHFAIRVEGAEAKFERKTTRNDT